MGSPCVDYIDYQVVIIRKSAHHKERPSEGAYFLLGRISMSKVNICALYSFLIV